MSEMTKDEINVSLFYEVKRLQIALATAEKERDDAKALHENRCAELRAYGRSITQLKIDLAKAEKARMTPVVEALVEAAIEWSNEVTGDDVRRLLECVVRVEAERATTNRKEATNE